MFLLSDQKLYSDSVPYTCLSNGAPLNAFIQPDI